MALDIILKEQKALIINCDEMQFNYYTLANYKLKNIHLRVKNYLKTTNLATSNHSIQRY